MIMACLSSCRATGRVSLRAAPKHPTVAPRGAVPGAAALGSCCRTQPSTRHLLLGSSKPVMKRQCYPDDMFGPYPSEGTLDQLPAIRAMVDDSRSACAQQVARDISQLLATAVPNLHIESGAYFWLSCEAAGKEPRVTVHLLTRNLPTHSTVFNMAVRADGRPADIVALASNTDMVNLTQQAIGEELKDRQEGLSFSWITDRTFYLNVGPQVPLRNILHVAWE